MLVCATVWIALPAAAHRLAPSLLELRPGDAGEYQVTWDGRNEQGNELASGVYYVRYDAGGERFLRKAVLLR